MTPMKAIRAKCLDCCCGQTKEVRLCPVKKRPLYLYRFGKRPKMGNYTSKATAGEKTLDMGRTWTLRKHTERSSQL